MKNNLNLKWCCASALILLGCWSYAIAAPERPGAGSDLPRELSLETAISLALHSNPELTASAARVEAALGRADQAAKWTNPELELNAEDWPVRHGRGFRDAKQTLGIAQTLPYPGKKSLDKQIGRAGVRMSEAEQAIRRTELVRDVKAAFFRVLASERLVEVSKELVRVAEFSTGMAQKRVEAGAAAYQEQLRAEVQLEEARSALAEKEQDLVTARRLLASLIGRAEVADLTLAGALADQPVNALMIGYPERELERHPSMEAARVALSRAELEQRRSRLEPYPDLTVALAGGRVGESDEAIVEMGFALPIPILDRGKGKQREAQANVKLAAAELAWIEQQLRREWANARQRYQTSVDQVKSYRERLLPKAEQALVLVRTGFEEGKFGFIDLADTQRTTADARVAYQEKLLEMNIAQAELEALLHPRGIQNTTTE